MEGKVGGFALARLAVGHLVRRPRVVVVVLVLASLSYLSGIAADGFYWQHCSRMSKAEYAGLMGFASDVERGPASSAKVPSRPGFARRWLSTYTAERYTCVLSWSHLPRFAAPLSGPTELADGWTRCLNRFQLLASYASGQGAYGALKAMPALLIGTLFLVGLLGWVRDVKCPPRLTDWAEYWRSHYVQVLLVGIILLAVAAVYGTVVMYVNVIVTDMILSRRAQVLRSLSQLIAAEEAVTAALLVIWMLAPFAVVARGLKAWTGIASGLRLLRHHWLSLAVLFVIFRAGREVVTVWQVLSPWMSDSAKSGFGVGLPVVLWKWARVLASALLGLWVAYAFMEIARPPAPVEAPAPAE
ncbi:MAG TPA: hypothetical protein VM221_03655 [Armatimonadota bacterium]|nr:hypothetical protein [Armatimonadota bacterium]